MRISDWSSDVCSSDLRLAQLRVAYDPFAPTVTLSRHGRQVVSGNPTDQTGRMLLSQFFAGFLAGSPRGTPSFHEADEGSREALLPNQVRSEEHKSELQPLMRISYAVFCLKKKKLTIQLIKTCHTISTN